MRTALRIRRQAADAHGNAHETVACRCAWQFAAGMKKAHRAANSPVYVMRIAMRIRCWAVLARRLTPIGHPPQPSSSGHAIHARRAERTALAQRGGCGPPCWTEFRHCSEAAKISHLYESKTCRNSTCTGKHAVMTCCTTAHASRLRRPQSRAACVNPRRRVRHVHAPADAILPS